MGVRVQLYRLDHTTSRGVRVQRYRLDHTTSREVRVQGYTDGRNKLKPYHIRGTSRYTGMNINRCAEIATNREEWRTIVSNVVSDKEQRSISHLETFFISTQHSSTTLEDVTNLQCVTRLDHVVLALKKNLIRPLTISL